MRKGNKKLKKDKTFPFWLISLLLPPVGIILYFIKKKDNKIKKSIITSTIVGFCIYAFGFLIALNIMPEKNVDDWYKDIQGNKEVVTVFGLTTCPHCKELKPVINKLAKKYKFNLYYFEVDKYSIEDNDKLLNTLELKDYEELVPFIFVAKNNEYLAGITGFNSQESLEKFLEENGVIKKD
ncbi:MAG: thioredoxin family protein [Bacilli bacterium]|nr:thioredoxin family protein [Bacilli bacterium]